MFLEVIVLMLAIPFGYLVAYLSRDELLMGVRYFRIMIIASVLLGVWFWLTGAAYLVWTFGFVFVVSIVGLVKAGDKKWTKSKI
jgi:hypothetical protein